MEASPSETDRLRRDVVWNLAPVVLLAVVGLGLNLVIGWWGPDALGAFNLVTPAFFAFAVLGAGGMQYAVLRSVAEQPDDEQRVAQVVVGALIPTMVLAAGSAIACFLLAGPVGDLVSNDAVTVGLRWVAPGVFCFAVNKVLFGVVNGLRRMRAFAIYTSLRYLLIAAGTTAAYVMAAPAEHLAVIWTFSEGALLLVMIGELLTTVRVRRARQWMQWVKPHLDFGLRGMPATLAFEINSKLDIWLLGIALPESQVGVYALASSLFEGAAQLSVVVQNTINPVLARFLAAEQLPEVHTLVWRTRKWFVPFMVVACVVSIVLYPHVVPVLARDVRFAEGADAFTVLMIGLALASPWLPFNQFLLMASAPGWHTLFVLSTTAVMCVACYFLIGPYGAMGAAIGTLISTLATAGLLVVFTRLRTGVRL